MIPLHCETVKCYKKTWANDIEDMSELQVQLSENYMSDSTFPGSQM